MTKYFWFSIVTSSSWILMNQSINKIIILYLNVRSPSVYTYFVMQIVHCHNLLMVLRWAIALLIYLKIWYIHYGKDYRYPLQKFKTLYNYGCYVIGLYSIVCILFAFFWSEGFWDTILVIMLLVYQTIRNCLKIYSMYEVWSSCSYAPRDSANYKAWNIRKIVCCFFWPGQPLPSSKQAVTIEQNVQGQ